MVEHHFRKVGVAGSIPAFGSQKIYMKKISTQQIWDREYSDPVFTSFERKPHQVVKDFLKYIRRQEKFDLEGKTFLDVGCGIGKDVEYAIDNYSMNGIGCDVSKVAIAEAKKKVPTGNFFVQDLGEPLSLESESIDCAVMVMVLHTLSKTDREKCFTEISRVMKSGGYFFLKTLALPGDRHAKYLIKTFPGEEPNSFIHPDLHVSEYVYSLEELQKDLLHYFEIISLEKTSGYQKWGNQSYKRNYWVAYLRKK